MAEVNRVQNTNEFGYEDKLKRTLTFKDLLVYGMIFMVPIAPMGVFGFVSQQSHGMVPLVYLVGVVAMIFTAFSYVKMSKRFPIAGSVYAYVQRGINPHVGFIAGWLIMLDYIMAPALLYAFSGTWLSSLTPGVPAWVWVIGFVILNTVINIMGIEYTAKTNMVLLILEVACLVVFLVVAVGFIMHGGGAGKFTITPLYQPGQISVGFIATAASIAVLSFLGFDAISTLAEETKNPDKVIGKATVASLIVVGAIFMLQTYVAALVAPDFASLNPDTAFFDIAQIAGGAWLKTLLIVVSIVASGIANTMAAQAAISRLLFSMSRDKLMPKFFSVIHPKYKTPFNSTMFVAIFSLVVALSVKLELLIKLVNFGALTSFMMLNFTVFWLFYVRERNRDLKGAINYILFPLVGLLIIFYVWWGFDSVTKIVGICWLVVGIIYGAVVSKGYKIVPEAFRNMQV